MSDIVRRVLSSIALVAKELGRVGLDRVLPARTTLPDTGAGMTPAAIEQITGQPAGSVRSVQVLDEHHGTAGRVRIAVETAPEGSLPETLFLKVAPRHPIQRVMMSLFELAAREVLFYDAVVDDAPVRAPACYGVQVDARRGRSVLALEDLSATATFRDIRDPVRVTEATAVVDALADLHATFWSSSRLRGDLVSLQARSPASERLGNAFVGRILGSLRGRSADVVPVGVQRDSQVIVEHRAEIDRYWRRQAQTLCHGDPHLGNLFFEGAAPGFLDWQAVMAGPGARDLSYFLIASMDVADLEPIERDLVDRYVERLGSHGVEVDGEQTWAHYRASAAEFYVSAIVTAGTSDRMQPAEISSVGVDRVTAAVQRLETFGLLRRIVAGDEP